MSTTSALESEDLEIVALVRMEDVQPDRSELYEDLDDDSGEVINDVVIGDEVLETCVVDSVDSDCVVNEDGDVVVTIQTEVVDCSDNAEIIVPEILEPALDDPLEFVEEVVDTRPKMQPKTNTTGSWPTLEILPGGVIKHADKCDDPLSSLYPTMRSYFEDEYLMPRVLHMLAITPLHRNPVVRTLLFHGSNRCDGGTDPVEHESSTTRDAPEKFEEAKDHNEMVYACAKCSQSFKYLLCLVKHVKWHEKQQKRAKQTDIAKISTGDHEDYVCLHSNKRKIISKLKSRCKLPKKS